MLRAVVETKGWNARAAFGLALSAQRVKSTVTLCCGGYAVNAKNPAAVLTFGPSAGQEVVLEVEGEDEQEAYPVLRAELAEVAEGRKHGAERLSRLMKALGAGGGQGESVSVRHARSVVVGYVPWRGYNYQDAIVVTETLLHEDAFASVPILEFEIQARETRLGPEEITRDIPGATTDELRNLDEFGVIRLGAEVRPGDILVGRVATEGEAEFSPEERFTRAVLGERAATVRDTSLRVAPGVFGVVVERYILNRTQTGATAKRPEHERGGRESRRNRLRGVLRVATLPKPPQSPSTV